MTSDASVSSSSVSSFFRFPLARLVVAGPRVGPEPGFVAAARVVCVASSDELAVVGLGTRACVGGVPSHRPESVDHLGRAHRVEVEPRDGVTDAGRGQALAPAVAVALDEVVDGEVVEDGVRNGREPSLVVGLGRVEGVVEEGEQPVARGGEPGGDGGEDVGPERGLGGEL